MIPVSRRTYLTVKAIDKVKYPNIYAAMKAVESAALEHPEWDMDEMKTVEEWEASDAIDWASW